MKKSVILLAGLIVGAEAVIAAPEGGKVEPLGRMVCDFPTGEDNPRNGEGDFVKLNDGRYMFAYTKFSGKSVVDHAPAVIAARISSDKGETWSEDITLVTREGRQNVMSCSLLRLDDKRIALFFMRKNSDDDCVPCMRITSDDFKTMSETVVLMPKDQVDYYVLNNARAERLKSGRIILPLARHSARLDGEERWNGRLSCLYSDDNAKSWKKGKEYAVCDAEGKRVMTQEPGVIELKDGTLYMYARTDRRRQWQAFSDDGGLTWRDFAPSPIFGPCAPATIERLSSGELLLIWNDHEGRDEFLKLHPYDMKARAPLDIAISRDEGKTWINRRQVEPDRKGYACYFAVLEVEGDILLHYYNRNCLSASRMRKVPLE